MTARNDLYNYADAAHLGGDHLDELINRVEKEAASAALRDAADWAETANPDRSADFSEGVDWLLGELRRIAGQP